MTENEAKTKICHRTLSFMGGEDGVPSWQQTSPCIGSACMAWRWDYATFEANRESWEDAANIGGVIRGAEPCLSEYGFCGLAGKP